MSNQSLCCVSPPAASKRYCAGGTRWLAAGKEPALAELLADPLIGLVMRRDGVSPAALQTLVATAQTRLRGRLCCRSAA
ncbi:MAG TPA: hypothetical protein VHT04_17995 [Stellaceae bacterium]|jgi:NaMN:DMB phosphoribosyltransferase|nr:hypothetical protein [Stellaceae bacterium]